MRLSMILGFFLAGAFSSAYAGDAQLERGLQGIKSRTGCFLVDYSFIETEAVKPGYKKDDRVYDVNNDKSVKEWIFAEEVSPSRVRLQHVLFAVGLDGQVMQESIMKHVGEDWEYNAPFLYDFVQTNIWNVQPLNTGLWTRRITNLDDGLRYQCAAAWNMTTAYPEWSCDNYAPIPGRETRDMGRRDYQTLQRSSRIITYGANWLERENNTKIIEADGVRTPLAKEVGKNWYSRLPDTECLAAQNFVRPRLPFWNLVRETWDEVFVGDRPFIEKAVLGRSRYKEIMNLEAQYMTQDLSNADVRASAHDAILKTIQMFRGQ